MEKAVFVYRPRTQRSQHFAPECPSSDYLTEDLADELFVLGVRRIVVAISCDGFGGQRTWPWSRLRVQRIGPATFLSTRGGLVNVEKVMRFPFCAYPSFEVVITVAGDVVLCCNDYYGTQRFGNVLESSLLEIWDSERFRSLRQDLLRGCFDLPICRHCSPRVGATADSPNDLVSPERRARIRR